MSPIGRVFIVLNLLLAGAFVGFAGTYLQQANKWKQSHDAKVLELKKETETFATFRKDADTKATEAQMLKQQVENKLHNVTNERDKERDTNKQLSEQLTKIEANVAKLQSSAEAQRAENATAMNQAKDSYDKAIAAAAARDTAIREKDEASGKLRDANTKILGLEENLKERELKIAALNKDLSEKGLLLDVAKVKGFLEGMAVPPLAGTVTHVSGRLVTVSITENTTNAEVKPGYSFAIYDAGAYKGEARVTSAADGMAFCTVERAKEGATIKVGDRATTNTH